MSALRGAREATAESERSRRPGASRVPLLLGGGLRPIVLAAVQARPEMTLSVHSSPGELLGYAVVDRAAPGSTWGGMTIADDLSLDDACRLARATTLQLDLFSVRRGSHHCLLSHAGNDVRGEKLRRREEFLEAIQPLVENGLCTIIFTSDAETSEPSLARRGLVASATAATLAVLEHLQVDRARATVALHGPTSDAREVAADLIERGLRLVTEGDEALHSGADVVLSGAPLWSLGPREVRTLRARSLVALGATNVAPATELKLWERKILLIPAALASAGQLIAADLCARGLDQKTAISRTFTIVARQAKELLQLADERNEPLGVAIRDQVGKGGHATATYRLQV